MSELHHECGVVAVYHLSAKHRSPLCSGDTPEDVARLVPRMLLDIQNRGQLSAGMTSWNPTRRKLLANHRDLGGVSEVFKLNRKDESEQLIRAHLGRAAIGHVRYATCGAEDVDYAQPFERTHYLRHKWFTFAFNGELANYALLREEILSDRNSYLARETDTEIILHEISRQYSGDKHPSFVEVCARLAERFDGGWSLVYLNACGQMMLARDPLGIRPLCYAQQEGLFAAASESVPLLNAGFDPENIFSLEPGCNLVITPDGKVQKTRFAKAAKIAHCFFEWIYFANVASTMDGRSVYLSRKKLGEELADLERARGQVPLDDNTIVVPVPDTSKAAADAMAFRLGVPSLEGLIRNRYTGRTFIEGADARRLKVSMKYTPLREVLEGKRVLLVEDSIVRSTTMSVLVERIRGVGRAVEVHIRVACPPIVAPCYYGIDMSEIEELFAPKFLSGGQLPSSGRLSEDQQAEMAAVLGADSLAYLPVESIARSIAIPAEHLCQACITGVYPTPVGQDRYQSSLKSNPLKKPPPRSSC